MILRIINIINDVIDKQDIHIVKVFDYFPYYSSDTGCIEFTIRNLTQDLSVDLKYDGVKKKSWTGAI